MIKFILFFLSCFLPGWVARGSFLALRRQNGLGDLIMAFAHLFSSESFSSSGSFGLDRMFFFVLSDSDLFLSHGCGLFYQMLYFGKITPFFLLKAAVSLPPPPGGICPHPRAICAVALWFIPSLSFSG